MAVFMSRVRNLIVVVRSALYSLDAHGDRIKTTPEKHITFVNGVYETHDPEEINAIMRASQMGETITQVDNIVKAQEESPHVMQMITGANSSAPSHPKKEDSVSGMEGTAPEDNTQKSMLDNAMAMLEEQNKQISDLREALDKSIEAIKTRDSEIDALKNKAKSTFRPGIVYKCKECGKSHPTIAKARWCCAKKSKK